MNSLLYKLRFVIVSFFFNEENNLFKENKSRRTQQQELFFQTLKLTDDIEVYNSFLPVVFHIAALGKSTRIIGYSS